MWYWTVDQLSTDYLLTYQFDIQKIPETCQGQFLPQHSWCANQLYELFEVIASLQHIQVDIKSV